MAFGTVGNLGFPVMLHVEVVQGYVPVSVTDRSSVEVRAMAMRRIEWNATRTLAQVY